MLLGYCNLVTACIIIPKPWLLSTYEHEMREMVHVMVDKLVDYKSLDGSRDSAM